MEESGRIDEGALTKGQLRKLKALRKSVGAEIGERAFAQWLDSQKQEVAGDANAEAIADALWSMVERRQVSIPRGGYALRRGRRRIIVEPLND